MSFAGLAAVKKGNVSDIRISFGAVAPTVVRSKKIEGHIAWKNLPEIKKMIPQLARSYSALIDPLDDQRSSARYRKAVSIRLLEHFLRSFLTD